MLCCSLSMPPPVAANATGTSRTRLVFGPHTLAHELLTVYTGRVD